VEVNIVDDFFARIWFWFFQKAKNTKMGSAKGNKGKLFVMFTMTFTFFLVEISVGYATNSMALVADSFHMLSDVAALVVAFVSVKVLYLLLKNMHI